MALPDASSVLLLCSFLTGFSALLYETVWQRILGFFSGSDVVSATVVISAYLSGLATGSFISSYFVDRIRREQLVFWYAGLTFGIGIFAVWSTPLFYGLVYMKLRALPLSIVAIYGVLFLAVMTPRSLMGASFPLIGRILCANGATDPAGRLALLNGVNIFGAVIGSLTSGWYLIGSFGYEKTTYVGAAMDVAAAVFALAFGPSLTSAPDRRAIDSAARDVSPPRARKEVRFAPQVLEWAALTALSGFIAISLEVVWLRLLSIYIKSNSYLFAHLVAFILLGFSVGSMWGARLVRRMTDATRIFLWAQVGIAVYTLGSTLLITFFYPNISRYLGTELFVLDPGHGWIGLLRNLGRYVGFPLVVLFPATVLIGLTFPCSQKALQDDPALVGARVGFIQTANLVGNITGGLLTGLFLLDRISSFAVLRVLGGMGLVFVAVLLLKGPIQPQPGHAERRKALVASLGARPSNA